MKSFIEDGFEWVWNRRENDYVLAKSNTGLDAFDVPKDWTDCPYSYAAVETYYDEHPEKHFVMPEPIPSHKEELIYELNTLLEWFNIYDEKCMQYQRSLRLGTTWEEDITQWDALAVTNASRIKEIRKELEG